ncbi:hypothetical protein [Virgibacillus halodenitrificans]|uniref:hypothetical protein n=1 Tax=Virgibacillus halodenitrificans TaxID=1482 RepID=UPI00045D2B73|nr:hypothetical protein [Virgibacillus halodenitrificans]CDQ32694.1 dihydroorotate dehydrogenase 2 [Virgibacillus halodenitrificans]
MPDWSYHPMKRVLLDKMSARKGREFIHHSMNNIASMPGGRQLIGFLGHMKPPDELQKKIGNTVYSSPIGLSGHIDPKLSGVLAFQELGFGFLEIGPIVLKEPAEQEEPIRQNNTIQFSNQQEKVPLKLAMKKLLNYPINVPVVARLDRHVGEREWEVISLQLIPFLDAFILTEEQMDTFVSKQDERLDCAFYIGLHTDEMKTGINHPHIDGVVLDAPCRLNGDYWYEKQHANDSLIQAVKQMKMEHPDWTVITSGGVETPEEGLQLHQVGADLVMLSTGYVNAGPGLPKRIHERIMAEQNNSAPKRVRTSHWSFFFGLAILFGGIIAFFFALTRIILPYDEVFLGLTRAELLQVNPRILAFMSHDRMALAGTMISGGILYIQLARNGIKANMHWAKIAFHSAAIIGFLGIFLFIGFGYFDWLHGLYWLILLPVYLLSFKEAKQVKGSPASRHGTNDRAWKLGLYGQLLFVMLGFFIIIGGIVISTIGVTKVFVDTDLSFICMTPEMLDQINNKLIPVIAHDRAGFGSALVSVGLLVLMLSLWGFRQGASWVWNTIAIGALPAFIAGIGTHLYIGYTDFIHLLPVYFLVLLYVVGLILSYPILKRKPK